MTKEIMLHWLKECLIPSLPAARSAARRALLLMDGLSFHYGCEFIEACKEAHIEVMLRVPHSTRDTQGEDRVNFKILKPKYQAALGLSRGKAGMYSILFQPVGTKGKMLYADMAEALTKAFASAFDEDNCRNA